MKRKRICFDIGCVQIMPRPSSSCDPYWFDGENVFCRFIFCDVVLNNVCLMCYFSMFCRPLPRSMILNSGSTLRSRRRTRGTWSCARSGKRSGWRGWRRGAKRRQQKRRGNKKWNGGMLLREGRRGRKSLSMFAMPKQHLRRIQMH